MSIPPSNYPSSGSPSGSANGTIILILGILSLVGCSILGPVAWIMGNNAIASGVDPSQAGTVNAGRICGIIGTVLLVLSLIWIIFFGGLAMITAHHAATSPMATPANP